MTGRGEEPGRPGASGAHGAPGAHGVPGGAGRWPRNDEGGASGGTGSGARTPGGASAGTSGAGGAPGPAEPSARPEPSGVDLARVALRAAKEQARARGAAAQQRRQARRGGGLRSGARSDGRDPQPLGSAINRLITERGWETPAVVGGVMGRWPQIVGEDLANHCVPLRYDEDPAARVLTVSCDSTAWATQLRLLAPQLVARLNADLGQGTVRMIKVVGPGGGERRFGPLRAPGSKGPGDTYG
ncbi:Predicted nucleic acid-binding protein, contains Zn-ribbon domain (includes truncated derivatives) [Streptomyces sp. AmelKG-D3]|nr:MULTISPECIES: DciA family protein [unclassified Streptomyces]SCK52313.1 Predicted nucleic acid-binding protein, contains Zn-ribbon domain (includes truncated derivatives) [Streptomyces sp. AmelKG-D3]